jgi:hypothetical protein
MVFDNPLKAYYNIAEGQMNKTSRSEIESDGYSEQQLSRKEKEKEYISKGGICRSRIKGDSEQV